ncbi:MAG: acyl-CoA desaturase [Methanobacteriota archaeon]
MPQDPFPFARDPWWSKALVLLFVLVPLAIAAWGVVLLWGRRVDGIDVLLLLSMWGITGLGISLGFHRMLTHRAFEAARPVKAVLLVLGSMAVQGPAADWAATHIRHHARADKEGDPHSPVEGFLHAHTAWLVRDRFVRSGPVYEKIAADPIVAFVSRTFFLWVGVGLLIPAGIAYAVTGSVAAAAQGLLWGGVVRVFVGHHITWSVNSVAHAFGTRPFVTDDESRNNVLVALFGFGEGWHNNHHAFPRSAFIGIRWWQFDPGRLVIRVLAAFGLVWNVWLPSQRALGARAAPRRS